MGSQLVVSALTLGQSRRGTWFRVWTFAFKPRHPKPEKFGAAKACVEIGFGIGE